jgi:hypothetical protein
MKINHKLLSVGALSLLLGFTACDKDDDKPSGQLSKTEAKSEINAFNSKAKTDLQDLADANGLEAVQDFFELVNHDDPFGRIGTEKGKVRAFLRDKGREFRSVFAPSSITKGRTAEGAFDFEGNTGIYEWNAEIEEFELTGQSNIIRIKFPAEGSATNNAELKLSAFEEIEVIDEETGESYYEPTILDASIDVDGDEVAALSLDMEYDDAGFPVVADISLSVTPFTASLTVNASAATSSSIAVSLKQGSDVIVGTSMTVKYKSSSKSEEDLSSLEGYVQFSSLKLQGTVDLTSSSTNFNDFVKLSLHSNNKKVGDIVFETVNGQETPFIKYGDGTKEKLEDALKPVVDEIDALFEDLDVNG